MSLETDYTTVPGQVFACLSIIGPEAPQRNDKFGIKIRGAFATRDEAANHAKRLQKEDPTFDIYVVDMYKWLLIPPDPTKIEDVHYTNEKLEEKYIIIVRYFEKDQSNTQWEGKIKMITRQIKSQGDEIIAKVKSVDETTKAKIEENKKEIKDEITEIKNKIEENKAMTEEVKKDMNTKFEEIKTMILKMSGENSKIEETEEINKEVTEENEKEETK